MLPFTQHDIRRRRRPWLHNVRDVVTEGLGRGTFYSGLGGYIGKYSLNRWGKRVRNEFDMEDIESFRKKKVKDQNSYKDNKKMYPRTRKYFRRFKRRRRKMPFRRRKYIKRRKFVSRKRKRRATGYSSYKRLKSLMYRMLSTSRKYVVEDNESHDIAVGKVHYICNYDFLTRQGLKTAWDDEGDGSYFIGGVKEDNMKCHILRAQWFQRIRNISSSSQHVTVYWLLAKEDTEDATATSKVVIDALVNGWKDRMLDADETGVGTGADITSGAQTASTNSTWLSPFHSSNLMEKFKITKGKTRLLKPGEEMNISYTRRNVGTYTYRQVSDYTTTRTLSGVTAIPLIKVHMAMGKDALNQDEVAFLAGYFYSRWKIEYDFRFFSPHRQLIAFSNLKNDNFTNGGEGPETPYMQVDDD